MTVKPDKNVNDFLKNKGTSELTTGTKMAELLKRTEIKYEDLKEIDSNMPDLTKQEKEEVEIQIKYEGYIKLQEEQVEKFKKLENATNSTEILKIQEDIVSKPKYNSASRIRRKITPECLKALEYILNDEDKKTKVLGTNKQSLTKQQIHKLLKNLRK